jgi:hypothetical protein
MLAYPWESAMSACERLYRHLSDCRASIFLLRKILRRHVTAPLSAVNRGMTEGFINVRGPDDPPLKYTEAAELSAHSKRQKRGFPKQGNHHPA